jgi:hypothetical protein
VTLAPAIAHLKFRTKPSIVLKLVPGETEGGCGQSKLGSIFQFRPEKEFNTKFEVQW